MDFKVKRFAENKGHSAARQAGMEGATHDIVAIMDSDDIAVADRFEKQLTYMAEHPDIDVVGGQINEFIGTPDNVVARREVPCVHEKILMWLKRRCPFNHMSVTMLRSQVLAVGGYQEWYCDEDYYLWLRMSLAGCRFANLPDTLVNVRVGDDMYARRGGWRYFRSEAKLQAYMLANHIISLPRYLYNVAIRFGGEVVATNAMRGFLFKFMRKPPQTSETTTTATSEPLAQATSGVSDSSRTLNRSDFPPFSVAMSVYKNDNPEWFDTSLASLVNQTLPPSEIVLVVDGPISQPLEDVIVKYQSICKLHKSGGVILTIIRLAKNQGLGNALRLAIEAAHYDIVARMDSDDISVSDRFERQISFMAAHPDIDVVGGQIDEFIGTPDYMVGRRIVPCVHEKILMWLKGRCPFNHMSITMLRSKVLAVGNYQDWFWNEDYYLWVRMAQAGCRFANLPETLVNVRVGKDMYARRGGWRYFRSEEGIQRYMLRHGMVCLPRYLANVAIRFAVQVAMPNRLRGFVFQKLFRKQ